MPAIAATTPLPITSSRSTRAARSAASRRRSSASSNGVPPLSPSSAISKNITAWAAITSLTQAATPSTSCSPPPALALRVGLIAAQEKWCDDYSRATFHAWFIGRRAPGVGDHVEHILASLDKSAAPIIARAQSAEGERLAKEATDAARKLGIFGAPTFAIGAEIF